MNVGGRLRRVTGVPVVSVVCAGAVLVGTGTAVVGGIAAGIGLLCLAAARYRRSRRLLNLAALALVASIGLAGMNGGSPGLLVVAAAAATVLWAHADAVLTARSLDAPSASSQPPLVSAALLLGVGGPAVLALVAYRAISGGPPPIVVAVLVAGATVLIGVSGEAFSG